MRDVSEGGCRPPLHFLLFLMVSLVPSSPLKAEGPGDQHFQAGLAYERLGRYDESYTELQLAFAVDQENSGLALALGIVASRLGRIEAAQRALERSVAIDSDAEASYYQLALIYEKRGAADRAADAWHRFLSLTPDELLKAVAEKHIQYLESHRS